MQQHCYSSNSAESSNSIERESHVNSESLWIPPEPLNLSTLDDIWEQVRACKREMASNSESKSAHQRNNYSLEKVLAPRNIRVHDDTDETPKDVWSLWLDQTRYAKANTDTMKRALQKDGLWLDEETEITGNTIEEEIERLTTYEANEAHWRTQFWELYFFRAPISGQACLIRKTEEQRQCHSHSYKIDQDPTSGPKLECDENIVQEIDQISRFVDEHSPPIVHGVHHSLPSNTLQRCKTSTGYVYNDLVYAVDAWKPKNEDFQKAIKDLPTVSSSQDKTHFGGWLLVEFKRKPSITETHLKGLAVRYGSFTAAVSLHEKLKLCSMASEGSFSKAQYKDLNVHIFSAVGFTAHHYIHCLRPGNPGSPVTYESYPIGIYHLNISSDRNHFRHTLNLLHVYHSTIIRDTELERLQTVVALNPTERYNRLQNRAHKNTWFEIKECKGEETIVPHNESLCHQAIAGEPVSGPPLEGYDTADPDPAEKKQQKEKKQRCGSTTKQGGACKNPASSCRFPAHQKQVVHRAKIANKKVQPGLTARRILNGDS